MNLINGEIESSENSLEFKKENLEEFFKIINNFTNDIITTFPEYESVIQKWWTTNNDSEDVRLEKITNIYKHCIKVIPEHFFDILYQNAELFSPSSLINSEFLPGISFKYLWNCDISDKTRETIWKYLQMILISITGSIKNKTTFSDTEKMFENINEEDFKDKLKETIESMQQVFEDTSATKTDEKNIINLDTKTDEPIMNDFLQDNMSGLIGGKLGDLAREIAEETTNELNLDMENITDINDVFKKLFQNPGKLMDLVKNVGSKLDTHLKSGDINETELMTEASDMLNKMKNMPGMENIQDMMGKMGMGDMMSKMGLGKFGSPEGAQTMEKQLSQNLKNLKTKEQMNKKMKQKSLQKQMQQQTQTPLTVDQKKQDELLISLFNNVAQKNKKTKR